MAVFQSAQTSTDGAVTTLSQNAHNVRSTTEDDVTLTTAQFINGVYIQTGTPGTSTKTTPTATEIVNAIRGCTVGTSFDFVIDNGGDGTLTLAAGTDVTLSGTATVAAAKNKLFRAYVTNATTPAVRVICMAQLA